MNADIDTATAVDRCLADAQAGLRKLHVGSRRECFAESWAVLGEQRERLRDAVVLVETPTPEVTHASFLGSMVQGFRDAVRRGAMGMER